MSLIYGWMAPPKTTRVGVCKDEDGDRMVRITNKSCYSRWAYTAIEMRVGKVLKAADRDTCSWGISFDSPSVSVSCDLRFFPRLVEHQTAARGLVIDLQNKEGRYRPDVTKPSRSL